MVVLLGLILFTDSSKLPAGNEAGVPFLPVNSALEARLDHIPTPTPIPTPVPTDTPTPEPIVEVVETLPPQAPVVYEQPIYPPGSIEEYICSFPWDCWRAICIAGRESGRDLNGNLDGWWAVNTEDGDAKGLFQIRESVHAYRWSDWYEQWMNPIRNTQYAFELWQEQGWYGPWYAQEYNC